jgi:hypothetical protein
MGWTVQRSVASRSKMLFSSPKYPNHLSGPPGLLLSGYQVLSQVYSSQGVKLTSHLRLVLRLRMSEAVSLLPVYAFFAWTEKTLPLNATVVSC